MADSFQIEEQSEYEWCWAAVGVSIHRYFSPHSKLRQCELATKVLPTKPATGKATTPCDDPLPVEFNVPEDLDVVLKNLKLLAGPPIEAHLSFSDAREQIIAGLPVCVRIGWSPGNRGHFVVIRDCATTSSGEQWVDIADPFYGYSTIRYDQFVSAYKHNGRWTATFLVREP